MNILTKEDAERLLQGQKLFFAAGRTRDFAFRHQKLQELYEEIDRREETLLAALAEDLGKCPTEAFLTEVGIVKKSLSLLLREFPRWLRPQKVPTPYYLLPGKSRVVAEPYGSVLIMGPFNYPFQLLLEPLISAVAAGNTCVLKPSELAPATARAVEDLAAAVFDPLHVTVVTGDAETAAKLLEQPFDYLFFTGGPKVGRVVMEAAARHLTPVTLELGGKSPVIIDDSAHLQTAARRVLWGKTLNMGQTCVAPDYVLVAERIADAFLEELQKANEKFFGEDPLASPDLGRIVNDAHYERLCALLDQDQDYLVFGGQRDPKRRFIAPTVLRLPDPNAAVMTEEIFGPLLPVLTFREYPQAQAIIARYPKPLALYIFAEDKGIQSYLSQIPAGGICINDTILHLVNPHLPFGGVGGSGFGAYHGQAGVLLFSHRKSILQKSAKFSLPLLYPPYKESALRLIKKILR